MSGRPLFIAGLVVTLAVGLVVALGLLALGVPRDMAAALGVLMLVFGVAASVWAGYQYG